MNLSEMNLTDVNERLAQLDVEVREAQDTDVVIKATEEKQALLERRAELVDLEQRSQDAQALETGLVEADAIVEERKEEIKMERTFAADSVEYREAWLKNLMGQELDVEERAAVTGQSAVIPTQTLNKIVEKIEKNPLIGKVDLMQIPGYVRIPIYSTNNNATWTYNSTDSADAFTYIDLQPYQLIKTIEIKADMRAMSIPAFESYIVKAIANRIETGLHKAFICGGGSASSEPEGILTTVATAAGTFTKAAATKADLLKIMGSLDSEYQDGAIWMMPSKVFYSEACAIADIVNFSGVAEGIAPKLFGHDVILSEDVTVGTNDAILYGDPKHYHANLGEGIEVAKDMSVAFNKNAAVYRGVCQADGKLDNWKAFVKFTRATA